MADTGVEVGKIKLGIELTTESVASQATKVEKAVEKAAEKAGKKAGKKLSDETAKEVEKGAPRIEKAGEKAGVEAGKGARKGIAKGSGDISAESGRVGDKAGKTFSSRFQKNASGGAGGLKGLIGKIGKALIAAFAVKKVFDFGKMAVNLGSDLNEVQNVVDSTFGQGSQAQKAVNDFAQNAAAKFGLSETMAKRYSGTFGAMGKAFGFTSDQAADMGTTLAGLSGDVASFYNITQDEAYTKLKSVFTGETESLKDLGVVMTQTALDQYALQHGFGQTTRTMSEQEKVALRYRFVLDKLSTASGDFSRTSGGWANQVRLLKLQFESLAATIGQVLIAALTPAIRALNAFMGVLIKAANTFKSFVFSLFGLQSQDMGTGSAGALPEALGDISSGAGDAADSLGDVGDAAAGAGKDASNAANQIKRSLASFDKITKLTDQSSSGSGSGSGGSGGGSGGSGGGSGGTGSLGDTSSALTNTAYSVAGSNGPLDTIIEKLKALKDMFMGGFWEGLGDLNVFDSILANIKSIGQNLKDIFTDAEVVKAAQDMVDKIAENIGKLVGSIVSVGATIADNLTGGFNRFLEQHKEEIKKFIISVFNVTGEIAEIVGNFAASFADVFSVFRSDEAKQITADIISIFATGFGTVIETSLKFTRDVISNFTKPFTENKDQIKQVLQDALGPISTVVSTIADTVSVIGGTVTKLYDEHVKPLLDSFGDGVSDLVKTFLDGWTEHIQPVLENLSAKFKEVFEDKVQPAIKAVGEALGAYIDVIRAFWENILQPLIKWVIEHIMPVIADLMDKLGGGLLDAIGLLASVVEKLAGAFKTVQGWIKSVIDWVGKLDLSSVSSAVSSVVSWAAKLPEKVKMTITGAKDKAFDAVKAAWESINDKTAEIKAKVSEFTDNLKEKIIAFAANLTSWTQNLKDKVINFVARMTEWVSALKDKVINFAARMTKWVSALKDKVINFAARMTKWVSALKDKVINFRARMNKWSDSLHEKIIAFRARMSSWSDSLKDKIINFKAKLSSWTDSLKDKVINFKAKMTTWTDSLKDKVINFKAKLTRWTDSLSNKILNFKAKLTSWFKRDGGVYNNGKWSPIQRYATGGTPDGGQVFVAREAGPELVGTLGGHTAVMNNDQIVASVSSGVAKAISGIKFYARGNGGLSVMDAYLPRLADIGNGIRSETAQLVAYAKQVQESSGTGKTEEIVTLLKKILEILLELDPDVYIDGQKVTARIVSIINSQSRAAGRPIVIV